MDMKLAWATKMILWILKFIAGLDKEDWEKTVGWVKEAEETLDNGKDRGEWVKEKVSSTLKHLAPYAVEAAIGLAVGYASKKGLIHLGDTKE